MTMESKSKTLSLFGFSILALIILIGFASAVTLSEWDFEASDLIPSTDITSGAILTISNTRDVSYFSGVAPSDPTAMSTAAWNNVNEYIEISVNTSGYEDIIIKFDEQVSDTGPTVFQMQDSAAGTTFTNLGSVTSTALDFTANPMHTFVFSSITTIDNNTNTEFRIAVLTAASDAAGTFRIDNLKIRI